MSRELVEKAAWESRISNHSSVAALTFTLHDWISAADEEIEQIWSGPWTNLKSLYIFIRLLSVGTQLFPVVLTLQPSSDSLVQTSRQRCLVIVGFQGVASMVVMIAVQAILLMRVEALYQEKTLLRRSLRLLYLGEALMMASVFAWGMPKIEYGLQCVVTYFPAGLSTGFLLLPISVELIFFVLTMIKFYEAMRDGWGRQPVIFKFLQDGIWAFALPFVILTINTACMALLPGPLSSIAYLWVIAVPGFAGCRLILNMGHLLRSSRTSGPELTYPEQDILLDTLPGNI